MTLSSCLDLQQGQHLLLRLHLLGLELRLERLLHHLVHLELQELLLLLLLIHKKREEPSLLLILISLYI